MPPRVFDWVNVDADQHYIGVDRVGVCVYVSVWVCVCV